MALSEESLLYEGKAKKVYFAHDRHSYIISYKDDATAFNGMKREVIRGKGELNNRISNFLMQVLKEHQIDSHFLEELSPTQTRVKKLKMFPLEVIVRNVSAGSITKRLGIKEGISFAFPILEFCYKNDALGDPMVNSSHIVAMNLASKDEIQKISSYALKVNEVLSEYFKKIGILLVDFKLEFGKDEDGNILLGDEISPDTCRFWDIQTRKKLDKDRFREDLGGICESYDFILQKMISNKAK